MTKSDGGRSRAEQNGRTARPAARKTGFALIGNREFPARYCQLPAVTAANIIAAPSRARQEVDEWPSLLDYLGGTEALGNMA